MLSWNFSVHYEQISHLFLGEYCLVESAIEGDLEGTVLHKLSDSVAESTDPGLWLWRPSSVASIFESKSELLIRGSSFWKKILVWSQTGMSRQEHSSRH